MNYLLFTVYLIIICWWLLRLPVIKRMGLDNRLIVALFLCKVAAGIAIGWISIHYYGPGNDYWDLNDEAWKEYQLLIHNPGNYFRNIFTSDYADGYGGMFSSMDSYWNDLKGNILIKMVSVFNLFSRGDYYINSLFFNFIVFFGHVALYKLFISIFTDRKWLVIIGCFLLPSTLYFSSGLHKDGIVFLVLSVLIYCVYQGLTQNNFTKKQWLFICISLVFIFLIRHYIFLALAPALLAWIISAKTKWKPVLVFAGVYLVTGLLLFNVDAVFSKIKPLEIIIAKQTEYLKLPKSDTEIKLTRLEPSFKSFASNTPESMNHLLLRPYIWELPVKTMMPLCAELLFYQLLLLLFIFYRRKINGPTLYTLFYFILFFTLSIFLLTGYIVPNLGSIVRYRSIYLPLIITPLMCMIKCDKMPRLSKIKI